MNTQIFSLIASLAFYTASAQFPAAQKVNVPQLSVQLQDDVFLLEWSVLKEINTSYFVVEKSMDGGKTFIGIATLKAAGYSSFSTHYTFEEFVFDYNATYRVSLALMEGLRIASNVVQVKELESSKEQTPLVKK